MGLRPTGVVEPLPLVVLRPGQAPVRQGEPCAGVWRVQAGLLCASVVDDEGRELWLDVMGPGDVVGDGAGIRAAWTSRALRPSRLVAASAADAEVIAARTARLAAVATEIAWLGARERVERRLLDLAERFGVPVLGGVEIPFPLRQDDLAALAGTCRETATRAVHAMTAEGRLERIRRGRYVVRSGLRSVGA